jgi:hypothetical protein
VTVDGPLSSQSQANKGSRNIAPFGQFGPAVLVRRRGRAASEIRCPRELDVLLVYAGSRETPGRVHDPVLPAGKTTVVVHPLSISARVARLLNNSAEPVNVRPRRGQSLRRVVLLRAGLGRS